MNGLLIARTRRGRLRVGVRVSPRRVRWFRGRTSVAILGVYDHADIVAHTYRVGLTAMGHTADGDAHDTDCVGCVALSAVRQYVLTDRQVN